VAGPPEDDRLGLALEIVRGDGSLSGAREAVTREVSRAKELAERLPDTPARQALLHITEFIAERCGARA
jgi:geranylgeranyl pyrophosphate synthase